MNKPPESKEKKGLTVLAPEDNFQFECRPALSCFTRCCRDITIFLSPYDIIRMKNALKITSEAFLSTYTLTAIGELGLPVVVLKMADNTEKSCFFLTPRGCSIYGDRPWSCRMYPLQPESTRLTEKAQKEYCSVMDVPFCLGLAEDKAATVADWLESQGIAIYKEMEKPFKKIMTSSHLSEKISNKKIQEMFYMACYDIDRFRRFVFESSFLKIYEIDPALIEKIKDGDDGALYQLAMQWLEHGLIGQQALKLKPEVIKARKEKLGLG